MIFLVIILIVAVIGGVIAYMVFQFTSVGAVSSSAGPRLEPGASRARVRGSLVQRLEDAPQGCLWSAIIAMALWVGLWLVVLILGLRVLLA
ncbi:MAG TPA: hypothetical protein VM121_01670 [Acidimicrobiales bacterium]|nr:hypothetical protein [Acidimicrobiales bacterium]